MLEATLFSGWMYDVLKPHAAKLLMADPRRLKAISGAKKKSDPLDAAMLADLLRCNLLPSCYVAPAATRELRRMLRYRSLMVRQATRMKNRTACLLMEVGAEYNKEKLHGQRYFDELVTRLRAMLSGPDEGLPHDLLWYQLALTLESLGRDAEAGEAYLRIVEDFPQSAYAATARERSGGAQSPPFGT